MMRVFVIFCFFATTVLATSSWPSASYAEVRGYAYNPKGKFPHKDRSGRVMMYEPLVYDGKLAEGVVDKGGVPLSAPQIQRLIRAITKKPPATIVQARCFDPHHGFVFYNATKKPLAWVEVCFECNRISTEPRVPSHTFPDMQALSQLYDELKLPRDP
jgi:hypothetical protein